MLDTSMAVNFRNDIHCALSLNLGQTVEALDSPDCIKVRIIQTDMTSATQPLSTTCSFTFFRTTDT